MRLLLTLTFLISLILSARSEDVLSWKDDRKTQNITILAWEVELSQSFVGPWTPFATVYAPQVSIEGLADGIYFARVRAIGAGGIESPYCSPIRFTVPRPVQAPPPTHVKLTVLRSTDGVTWQAVAEHLDPINSRSLYKLESTLVTNSR